MLQFATLTLRSTNLVWLSTLYPVGRETRLGDQLGVFAIQAAARPYCASVCHM